MGVNRYNTHESIKTHSIHAEVDAVMKLKKSDNKKKINVIVFRTNKQGNCCLMAKPCDNCLWSLEKISRQKNYIIHRIYYTDEIGNLTQLPKN